MNIKKYLKPPTRINKGCKMVVSYKAIFDINPTFGTPKPPEKPRVLNISISPISGLFSAPRCLPVASGF